MGWTLLRFTWEDIHDHPETVASHIHAALRQPTLGSLS
jgi:very-short-patch-repair endonuclease